jgi:hypothetical protein
MRERGERQIIPKELRRKAASFVWEEMLDRNNLEFSASSQQNLTDANQLLKESSLVAYLNHSTQKEDVIISVVLAFNYLTNAKRIIGPAAMRHYDLFRDPKHAIPLRMLKPLGIEFFPIVQPLEIDKNAGVYNDERTQKMSNKLKEATMEAVRNPGSIFGITPEGTRNDNGALINARRGIGYLESYDPDHSLYYLPVALVLPSFSNNPKIEVGKALKLNEIIPDLKELPDNPKIRAQFLTDIHMQRLARMLPEEMRGVYSSDNH